MYGVEVTFNDMTSIPNLKILQTASNVMTGDTDGQADNTMSS
jgi:hypothetical protein